MFLRADHLRIGDHLPGGEVIWVLPTPDRTHIVVGLRSRPRTPGRSPRQVIRSFRPGELVTTINPGQNS